jgi:hypothetical protein
MADTTDIEKKSLEAHVELCAERYGALELQISAVKDDISSLKKVTHEVHEMVHEMTDRRNNQIIGWAVGLIASLCAACGYLITHYVIK